jgi:two-component system response regulator AtoC
VANNCPVIVIDDELASRQILAAAIEDRGYVVYTAGDAGEAMKILANGDVGIALCDICLPGTDGIELMTQVRAAGIDTTFIMFTAFASVDNAVSALRLGAADYIIKPVRNEEILHRIRQVEALRNLKDENKTLRNILVGHRDDYYHFKSPSMAAVERMIRKVAPTDSTVLVTGESGTGKGVVARAIHHNSMRRDGPFLPVNCSAIPQALIESEFFGHTKGAFTGADKARKGLFLQAENGTIFLDEIGELPLDLQPKLLHALEDRQVRAVGSEQTRDINARIVTATNRNIPELIKQGRFREDLYFRLSAFEIVVPPLRQRTEEIPELVRFLLSRANGANVGREHITIDPAAEELLKSYEWPGNIRELENVITRAHIMADGARITVADLPEEMSRSRGAPSAVNGTKVASAAGLREKLRRIEAEVVLGTIEECGGDRRAAAELLEISVSSLYRKLQEYEMDGFFDGKTASVKK